jgi:murein DD-endopeptidase MepM/ murein hydrolase activator NlpD
MAKPKQIYLWIAIGGIVWLGMSLPVLTEETAAPLPAVQASAPSQALPATPIFRSPVVAGADLSGYFDHNDTRRKVTFYNGRTSAPENGFLFTCADFDEISPAAGSAWIGCEAATNDEATCPNDQELWYDNHNGLDYEYDPNWHTGSTCDRARFVDNPAPPVQAPATGYVDFVGEDHPFNGNFIRLYHDLNGDGNFYNDGLRSYYLHFADNGIVVDEGTVVQEGELLGYGGMTGLSWTPHLHFEVQRHTEEGWLPVDPFGWTGPGPDPWPVPNHPLWQPEAASESQ